METKIIMVKIKPHRDRFTRVLLDNKLIYGFVWDEECIVKMLYNSDDFIFKGGSNITDALYKLSIIDKLNPGLINEVTIYKSTLYV
jgi:hypothetical protein